MWAWFRTGHFRVTEQGVAGNARRGAIARGGAARGLEQPRAPGSGGAAEGLVAEHLQPVVMLLAAQQLRRALAHPLCVLAPLQTPVIEEEPQQFQIVRSQLPPQEKV